MMDKCSVLLCGFLLVLSPVLGQQQQQQEWTNVQIKNLQILDSYCQPSAIKTYSISESFRLLCEGRQALACCNHVAGLIQSNPNSYLCSLNSSGYKLTNGCRAATANFDQQIGVRIDDSIIHFPQDPHDAPDTVSAQQLLSTSPRIGTNNQPDNRLVQTSNPQNRAPAAAPPSRPLQPNGQVQRQPVVAQPGQAYQQFNFGDPKDNIQVPIAPAVPSRNNALNQYQSQPTKLAQRPSTASNSQSNYNYDDDDDEDDRPVVQKGTQGYQAMEFALNLFKNLDRPANSDSVISPLLPQLLLSNLVDYASPLAKSQLSSTIRLHPNQLANIASKLDKISKSTVNTIETASANFIAQDVNLNKTYASDVRMRNVEVKRVDFGQAQNAARIANNWVSGKTHGLINEILNPSAVNPYTRLLLANTIYFKGTWKYTFIESNPGTFESSPDNKRQLNKMFQLNKLRYGELSFPDGNGLRWVELPYEGNNLAMLVFLPTVRHQLEASVNQLTADHLARVMADLQTTYINTKVHLHMPKFTLSDSVSLIPALKRMGLHSIFQDPDALQYITNESTVVSDVTQRSYMSVDEFGTKATSVASLSIITLSITPQYRDVKFDVDQPFLTMIVEKQERYPFFIAQINDPRE